MIGCGWKSGADQSMFIWELTLFKAKFGHNNVSFRSYSKYNKNRMPKVKEKSVPEEEVIEIEDEPQEDTGEHGVVNPVEARHHIQLLDEAMQMVEAKVNTGEIKKTS